jgi:hypothetical protein
MHPLLDIRCHAQVQRLSIQEPARRPQFKWRIELFNSFNQPQFKIAAAVIYTGGVGPFTSTSKTPYKLQAEYRFSD